MLPSVYVETTIPSYLTAWPSKDVVRSAHQQITLEWWESRRTSFRLFTSELALDECAVGDPTAARERLRALQKLPLLEVNDAVIRLTGYLLAAGCVPAKAATDAAHLAVAACMGWITSSPGIAGTSTMPNCFGPWPPCASDMITPHQWFAPRKNLWETKAMTQDSIVTEVRAARETILKRFDNDIGARLRDAQQRQRRRGKRVVSFARLPSRRRKSA